MLLAEFRYDLKPAPTIPFLDTIKERRDTWLLKRYGLPAFYWHAMLPGLANPWSSPCISLSTTSTACLRLPT